MSRNAFPALERDYTAELEESEAGAQRLREWIDSLAEPTTAESDKQEQS